MNRQWKSIARLLACVPPFLWAFLVIFLGLVISEDFPPAKWLAILVAALLVLKVAFDVTIGAALILAGMVCGILGSLFLLIAKIVEGYENLRERSADRQTMKFTLPTRTDQEEQARHPADLNGST